jgi:hypothetical protein
MLNPYIQAALTYFRHPFSSMRLSFLTLGILIVLAINFFVIGRSENHHEFSPIHLFFFMVLFHYWAIHLKEQFTDSRASLTPRFRMVHGVVAVIAAIVFGVLLPGVMAPLIGWQSLGFISVTTLLFGVIIWLNLHPRAALGLILIAGCLAMFAEPVRGGLEQIVCGRNSDQAFVLFGIGAALSIAGIVRLFLLNEEMPEYHLKLVVYGRIRISDLQRQRIEKWYSRGWRSWLAERPIVNLIHHARHASHSKWSRVRRWDISNQTVWSACPFTIGFYVMFLVMNGLTSGEIKIAFMFGMASVISAGAVSGIMFEKNRSFSHELMMPVSRDAYLKQLGMSAAVNQLFLWGAAIASIILWMFTAAGEPHPELLVYVIAFSALVQIWIFGLAVRLLRFQSIGLIILVSVIALISTMIPLVALEAAPSPIQWRPFLLIIGGLFACLGLLLTWRAYRRWSVADFD